MGRVKFGPERMARRKKVSLVIGIGVVVMGALFLLGTIGGQSTIVPAGWMASVVVVAFILGVFLLMAYFLELRRLYLYAVMFALPEILNVGFRELAGIDIGFIASAIPTVVVMTTGLVIFVRFLRTYPVQSVEDPATEGVVNG
jgi:hypothetical protein